MIECCETPEKVREQGNLYLLMQLFKKIKFNLSLKNLNADIIFVSIYSTDI